VCDIDAEAAVSDDFSSHVAVDLGELRDVATWLSRQAQALTGDREHLSPIVHFGRYSPCGETHLARRAALSALDEHRARWDGHQQELATLAATLDKALDRYADSDNLRKLDLDQ
jgi:hypothetical protein